MVYIIIWIISAVIAVIIGSSKGRAGLGLLLGLLLGFIGVLIIALVPPNKENIEQTSLLDGTNRKCPYCAELIKRDAKICKHCGKEVEPEDLTVKTNETGEWYCPRCKHLNYPGYWKCEKCSWDRPNS